MLTTPNDLLSHAYDLVRANKGVPGIDGITFKAIERGEGKAKYLVSLKEALQEKTYRTQALKRVWIPTLKLTKTTITIYRDLVLCQVQGLTP